MADCEIPLATIDVMNRIAKLFGYEPLRNTTEVPGHSNLFLHEVECARPTTSLSRKGQKPPIVYIGRGLISDKAVTPPLEGTSTSVKATSDERLPEQELQKSREEPPVIHDNHSINDTRASMDERINANYNQQQEVSATSVTKPRDRVLRDKTNVANHSTPPRIIRGTGKHKDTQASRTSYSPSSPNDPKLKKLVGPSSLGRERAMKMARVDAILPN